MPKNTVDLTLPDDLLSGANPEKLPDLTLPDDLLLPAKEKETTWGDIGGALVDRIIPTAKRGAEALIQAPAIQAADTQDGVIAANLRSAADAARQGVESAVATLASVGLTPDDFGQKGDSFKTRKEKNQKLYAAIDRYKQQQILAQDETYVASQKRSAEDAKELKGIMPEVDPWSAKGLALNLGSALEDMVPAIGAGVATRSPTVGLAAMVPTTYGQYYNEGVDKGLTPSQAKSRAGIMSAMEPATTAIPLGQLLKPGAGKLTDLAKTAIAEGGQEMLMTAIQAGYDTGILDEKITLGQFLNDMAYSGVLGVGAGGTIHGVMHGTGIIKGGQNASTPDVPDAPPSTVPDGEYDAVAAETAGLANLPGMQPPPAAPAPDVRITPEQYAAYKAQREQGATPVDALDAMSQQVTDSRANTTGDALDALVNDIQPADPTKALRYGLDDLQIPAYLRQQPEALQQALQQAPSSTVAQMVNDQTAQGAQGLSPLELPNNLLPSPGQASTIALPGELWGATGPTRPRFNVKGKDDEQVASLHGRDPLPELQIPELAEGNLPPLVLPTNFNPGDTFTVPLDAKPLGSLKNGDTYTVEGKYGQSLVLRGNDGVPYVIGDGQLTKAKIEKTVAGEETTNQDGTPATELSTKPTPAVPSEPATPKKASMASRKKTPAATEEGGTGAGRVEVTKTREETMRRGTAAIQKRIGDKMDDILEKGRQRAIEGGWKDEASYPPINDAIMANLTEAEQSRLHDLRLQAQRDAKSPAEARAAVEQRAAERKRTMAERKAQKQESPIVEPGSDVDTRAEAWNKRIEDMPHSEAMQLAESAGVKVRMQSDVKQQLRNVHPDDLDAAAKPKRERGILEDPVVTPDTLKDGFKPIPEGDKYHGATAKRGFGGTVNIVGRRGDAETGVYIANDGTLYGATKLITRDGTPGRDVEGKKPAERKAPEISQVDQNSINDLIRQLDKPRRKLADIKADMAAMREQTQDNKSLYDPVEDTTRSGFRRAMEARLRGDAQVPQRKSVMGRNAKEDAIAQTEQFEASKQRMADRRKGGKVAEPETVTLPGGHDLTITPTKGVKGMFEATYKDGRKFTLTEDNLTRMKDGIANPDGENGALVKRAVNNIEDTRTPEQRRKDFEAENKRREDARAEREKADANPEGKMVGKSWKDDNGTHTVVSESRRSPGIYRTDTGVVISERGIEDAIREQRHSEQKADNEASMVDYTKDMPAMVRGRVQKTLRQQERVNGKVMSRFQKVEGFAKEGRTVQTVEGKLSAVAPDNNTFMHITKAEADYLEHLNKRKDSEQEVYELSDDIGKLVRGTHVVRSRQMTNGEATVTLSPPNRSMKITINESDLNRYLKKGVAKLIPSQTKITKDNNGSLTPESVAQVVRDFKAGLKGVQNVDFVIVPKQSDLGFLPEGVTAMAFYDPGNVRVIAVAENLKTPEEVMSNLRHEVIVHYGLRARLSKPEYDGVMDRILAAEGKDKRLDPYFKQVRKDYGDVYDLDTPDGRRMIAEEVVASVAETDVAQKVGVIRNAIEAIRKLLVKAGILPDRASHKDVVDLIKANTDFLRHNRVDNDDVRRSIAPMRFDTPDNMAPAWKRDRRLDKADVPDDIKADMKHTQYVDEGTITKTVNGAMDRTTRNKALEWVYQGMIDDLSPIARYEKAANAGELRTGGESAYKMATNSRQANSIVSAAMNQGVPTWKNGGVMMKDGSKGLLQILDPIAKMPGGQLSLWEHWAGAVRAKRLLAEGRENLYSPEMVDRVINYVNSKPDLRKAFNQAHKEYQEYKKGLLDFAEEAGIIDPAARLLWDKDDYVPLYRMSDDLDKATAPGGKSRSFVNQSSGIKTLKGGEGKVDILQNMVLNANHLITSAYNNKVGQLVAELAEGAGMVEVPANFKPVNIQNKEIKNALNDMGVGTTGMSKAMQDEYSKMFIQAQPVGQNIVSVMYDGKRKFFEVTDKSLMKAINQVGPRQISMAMQILAWPKHLLTRTVTSTPDFVLRNFTRDMVSAHVQSPKVAGRNSVGRIYADAFTMRPLIKALQGAKDTIMSNPNVQAYRAAGGFSGGYDGVRPDQTARKLRDLQTSRSVKRAPIRAWEAYEKVLEAGELASRMHTFDAVLQNTGDITEATYQANDVMNFSRRGDFVLYNFVANSVPFFNARIQGLDKMARAAKENPKGFLLKASMVFAASAALMAINKDDERYWALNESIRDNYWVIPTETGFVQIPKPFELGSFFGTVPERMYEAATRDDKVFMDSMFNMFLNTFAMNPLPQAIAPIWEDTANKDSFTGFDIVSQGMKFKEPKDQFNAYTAEFIKDLAAKLPDSFPETFRSPVRLQHMLEGYTGSMGQYVISAADAVYRTMNDRPEMPARPEGDIPLANVFVKEGERSSKYIGRVYEMQKQVRQANASLKQYREAHDAEGMRKTMVDKRNELQSRKAIEKAAKRLTDLSSDTRKVITDGNLTPEQKRLKIDEITRKKNEIAKEINDKWWRTLRESK